MRTRTVSKSLTRSARPRHVVAAGAATQPLPPQPQRVVTHSLQGNRVSGNAVIRVVPTKLPRELLVLLPYRLVAICPTPLTKPLQRTSEATPGRLPLHRVSFAKPDQVREARRVISPKVKTDRRDAYVIARLPYIDPKQLQRVYVSPAPLRRLKALVSQRASMMKELVSLKNRLVRCANAVCPGVSRVFDDLDSAHARAFVQELDPRGVLELGKAALAHFLASKGRITEKQAEKLVSGLVPLAQRALRLQELLEQGQEMELERQHAGELVRQIESLEQWIGSKEGEIREAYDQADPKGYVISIPGVGENTAPALLSYFGESERFETSRKAQGFVGLFPESDASGDSDRKGTALTKRDPAGLRRDLFLVADHFRRNDPQGALLYHDQMVHRGKHHNSALCVVANRLVIPRILAVVKEQRAYEYRDFDGNRITKEEARELVSGLRVSEEDRRRLRSRRWEPTKRRESEPAKITSELEAPRKTTASRRGDGTPGTLSVTKEQLGMLVFRSLEQLLMSGENLEEIRFQLRQEAEKFFEKRT